MNTLDADWDIESDREEEDGGRSSYALLESPLPAKQLESLSFKEPGSPQPSPSPGLRRQATDLWTYFSGKKSESTHAKKASLSSTRPTLETQASSWVHIDSVQESPEEESPQAAPLTRETMLASVKPHAAAVLADPGSFIANLRVDDQANLYLAADPDTRPEASTSKLSPQTSTEEAVTDSAQEQSVQREKRRKEKFLACLAKPTVDISALRKLSWNGIPPELRPLAWQLLLGYLPAPASRRVATLARKRQEYADAVKLAFKGGTAALDQAIWHQIHIDVPRTNPGVRLWSFEATQRSLERILYVWAVRHPASGYVQGINDLVTPFFQVFLSSYIDCDPELFDVAELPDGVLEALEADSFWCLSKLLDGIQDNYLSEQPGIQRQVARLQFLCERVDAPLADHLNTENVAFIQFAFKWIHLLLLRVLPIDAVIRMWDTYMSEGSNAFNDYHTYVCLAFLLRWSAQLKTMDFQALMLFFQCPVKHNQWLARDTEVLLSEGFLWKSIWSAK